MLSRRAHRIVLLFALLVGGAGMNYVQAAVYNGNCGANGSNLTWSLNTSTGKLTISGSGAMADYTSSPQPWASYISYINSVVLPEGITSIGIRAFKNHTALSSINLPSTLTNIGLEAFRATALTSVEIPSGMQWISYWTFKDCASLTTVRLPASITSLPTPGAFCGCTSLQFVYVSWETASQIPTCSNTSNFFHDLTTKPTLYVPCGTISLYQNKGWNNKFTITDVLLSGTCGSNLTWSLNTCGVLTISGTGAMSNYPGMTMPWRSRRASITSVVISDGVTSIGYNAFNGCSNLTSVTIPPSVTSIEQNAFYGCYAMESLYITDLAAWCNVEFGVSVEATPFMRNNYNSGSTEYLGGGNLYLNGTLVTTLTIPDGITEIKNLTFLGCSSITSIDFNQVTTIGSASFKGCHGLTSVTLPEGVTSLKNAFPYCTQLQSISIPASLTSLASQTLYHSDALTDIYVYWTDNIPGWKEYFTSKTPQSSITLHVPCGTEELYNTTANWKKYHIEADIPNVKSGTYGPDNIEWTFDYCDSLLTITGNGELQCDQNTWGPNAGGINPNAVKSVFIGKGVTYLGIYTLSYMTNIEYIEIEEGHPTHRTGCNAIIRIGSEHEGDTLIFGCPHTVIPTTCTTIRGYAFWDNHHVTEMTIPSSVKQIANMQGSLWQGNNGQVFYTSNSASEGLKDLYVEWTKLEDIPAVPNNRLGDMTKVRLHVPCGTTSLYKQVTGWSNFKEYIEESATFTITVQSADPTMGDVSIVVNP